MEEVFTPLGKQIFVLREDISEQSKIGLTYLQDPNEGPVKRGTVIAAGPDVDPQIKPGVKVAFQMLFARPVQLFGKEHFKLYDGELEGIIEEN